MELPTLDEWQKDAIRAKPSQCQYVELLLQREIARILNGCRKNVNTNPKPNLNVDTKPNKNETNDDDDDNDNNDNDEDEEDDVDMFNLFADPISCTNCGKMFVPPEDNDTEICKTCQRMQKLN